MGLLGFTGMLTGAHLVDEDDGGKLVSFRILGIDNTPFKLSSSKLEYP